MMNIESFRGYCLSKKGATECFPFDETTMVMKVMNKMFALADTEDEFKIALKCAPQKAVELREKYPAVAPGYHFNKKHWNTVTIDGSIPEAMLLAWIDHSYDLVVEKLTKRQKRELEAQQ